MFYLRLLQALWMIPQSIWGYFANRKKEADQIKVDAESEELRKNPYKNRNIPIENVIGAFKRGFYEAALGATEKLKIKGKPTDDYCFYRGEMLMHLGKLKEAEPLFRQCLELEPDKNTAMQAHTSLGNLMLATGRCDEALEQYQFSLQLEPNRNSAQRAMAEAYLVKGDTEQALLLARTAAGNQGFASGYENRFLGERLATLAWALAANGAPVEEVDELVKRAVETVGLDVVSSTAQVHTQAGAAYSAIGEKERSAYHLGKAAVVDSNGLWGRRAKAMMGAKAGPPNI